jgi:hypothetical protein
MRDEEMRLGNRDGLSRTIYLLQLAQSQPLTGLHLSCRECTGESGLEDPLSANEKQRIEESAS